MSYTFKSDITSEAYMQFLQLLPHYNIMQTPMWAQVKTGWTHAICGLYQGEELIAASLLLIRRLPLGIKIMYAPRGIMIDYSNIDHLIEFTKGLKNYARKMGAYVVRIDPEIILSKTFKGITTEQAKGHEILERVKCVGYLHMGFAKDFHTYTQPRFNAEYRILNDDGKPLSDEAILTGFDKKVKKFIGRYTEERGIFFENSKSETAVELFSQISEHTEDRQHILLRDLNYFKRIQNAFNDDNVYFFAKIDLDKFISFSEDQIKNGMNTEQAESDIKEAKEIKDKKGNIVTLSALLTIKNKDTAYLMYSGFDDSIFPRFRTTNQLRYEAMKYFRDCGCKVFSFMGVDGNLTDSLSEFKLKFNPYVVEYVGEFEFPVRKFTYSLMTMFFPLIKRLYIRFQLFFKSKKSGGK